MFIKFSKAMNKIDGIWVFNIKTTSPTLLCFIQDFIFTKVSRSNYMKSTLKKSGKVIFVTFC